MNLNRNKVRPAWHFLLDSKYPPQGFSLPHKVWVRLNRIWTVLDRSGSALYIWGMHFCPECDCGPASDTMQHITYGSPMNAFSGTIYDFLHATLQSIQCLRIIYGADNKCQKKEVVSYFEQNLWKKWRVIYLSDLWKVLTRSSLYLNKEQTFVFV